jgi:hypothetical protein
MAQKSKKQARKAPAVRPAPVSEEVRPASTGTTAAPSYGSQSRSFATEFNPDYSQTIKDLKRIAILAGSFFVILIALALILP